MFFTKKKPYAFIILDGWGMAPPWGGNAISLAEVRNFNEAFSHFPHTSLAASDGAVGLPLNEPGNSEAGHLNIGAGRVVYQDQPIIDKQISDGRFFQNEVLTNAVDHAKKNKSSIHIMGLLSKTGTHSDIRHLKAILELIAKEKYNKVFIHLFGDGRDSDSMSGIEMLSSVEEYIKDTGIGQIATLIGRFYAMDRDNRWERVSIAYDLLTKLKGAKFESPGAAFTSSYSAGITDEFIRPSVILSKHNTPEPISNNDSVIFFNYRADRAKELTRAFLDPTALSNLSGTNQLKNIYFATFVMHNDSNFGNSVFKFSNVESPIAKIWSESNLTQFHIAETEKYAHVTYFFNGGKEQPFFGEERRLIPSPKSYDTYDKIPEMSAEKVTSALIDCIRAGATDCFVANFANPDMVGHTGNLKATIKAVEYVDRCLGLVLHEIIEKDGVAFVFADHGNAEQMVNPRTGEPDTEHTTNPVPFILVSKDESLRALKFRADGKLGNIAPTMLEIMRIQKSKDMENSLIIQ